MPKPSETSLAIPDGMRLSDQWETRSVPSSTPFRLLRIAGTEPERVREKGNRSPVNFLSAARVAALDALVEQIQQGSTMAQLEGALIDRRQPETAPPPENEPPAQPQAQGFCWLAWRPQIGP